MISVKSISQTLKSVIDAAIRVPVQGISNIILLCGLMKRPGLSTLLSLAKIAQKMSEKGLPTEPNADGTPNQMLQFAGIVIDEVYRALREDAKISIVISPGTISIKGVAVGPSGSAVVEATNDNIPDGNGIIY